jgi:sigma-54 dependent transcriptional regulator, acetoin dehydrogenase operon transcriptional activator AcoR
MPDPILASWTRSAATGLKPDSPIQASALGPVKGRLFVAAKPVLDAFEHEIADTGFGVVLADRSCRVIDIRFGGRSTWRHAARSGGLEIGSMFTEENTGTNALATSFETRDHIYVDGDQHYLEALKRFACFGLPIFNPATSRLEGVIDIMVDSDQATPLMRPALHRLVDGISERLLDMSGRRERSALETFLGAVTAGMDDPVVVLEHDFTLVNTAARGELDAADYAELTRVAAMPPGEHVITLQSGLVVTLRTSDLPSMSGTLCTFVMNRDRRPVPRGHNADVLLPRTFELRAGDLAEGSVAVIGEPGSGRSTLAAEIIDAPGTTTFRCGAADFCADEMFEHLDESQSGVVLDDVHLLSETAAARLTDVVREAEIRIVFTMTNAGAAASEAHAALATCAGRRIVLPPLRERRDDFATLAASILKRLSHGRARLQLAAVRTLRELEWPGNLRELEATLSAVLEHRPFGDIGLADLPAGYSAKPYRTGLTPLEEAEAATIVRVMKETGGNKARAASRLAISRSTLYARIRAYRIRA